jgi:hypothetical protein
MTTATLAGFGLVLLPAFALLALSMERNHRWRHRVAAGATPRRLRTAGALLLAGCAAAASARPAAATAWICLVVAASWAALAVALLLSLLERRG